MDSLAQEVEWIARSLLHGVRTSGNGELVAPCPFHTKSNGAKENTPSFSLSTEKGLWQCFSCKEKGNFSQLLSKLGVEDSALRDQFAPVIEALGSSGSYVQKTLQTAIAPVDKELPESLLGLFDFCPVALLEEGFTEDTLQHFDVGFDDAHQRITFPLRDFQGTLIGISGRATGNITPRYKVYDTREYHALAIPAVKTEKRTVLWNLHTLRKEILRETKRPTIIIVEGFKACMWLHQAGLTNVVALLGSSISEEQALILEDLRPRVILMLDNDDAGLAGTIKVAQRLRRMLIVYVCRYQGRQPDCVSPSDLMDAINQSVPYGAIHQELCDVIWSRQRSPQ